MTLNEMCKKPLIEVLAGSEITSQRIITDDDGNVVKIIVEYVPPKN